MADPARHEFDVWPVTLWAASGKRQLRRVGKLGGPAGLDTTDCSGRVWSSSGGGAFHVTVFLAKGQAATDLVNTCAHEASHVVDAIFEIVDEEKPGCETRAYLMGFVTEWLLTHCGR